MSKFRPFKDIKPGTLFKIAKEHRPLGAKPAKADKTWYIKESNSRSRAFSRAKTIILALSDIVEVIGTGNTGHARART